jgi:3-methyl-2-oxobutanoate hydroxymethyltransferase
MNTSPRSRGPLRVTDLLEMKRRGQKIAMLTAYDATITQSLEAAGVEVLLVGDSLGMVISGMENTIGVTLDVMVHHCRAVVRGARRALVVADMPFLTYQTSAEDAMRNAGRLLQEGGVAAVKLEGGEAIAATIRRLTSAGVPVMGHLGLTPQSVHQLGGFRPYGKTDAEADQMLRDAEALQQAGVFAIVLESIPTELAARVTAQCTVPTIGIGAGPHCDGQVLVCYDALGLLEATPRFVKRYAELGKAITEAARSYVEEVKSGAFPAEEHSIRSNSSAAATRRAGKLE